MSERADDRRRIAAYLLLTFGFSSFFYYRIISEGGLAAPRARAYILGLMWCPGAAALVTQLLLKGSLRGLGWGWGKMRYQLASYLVPLAYAAAVYIPVWLLGLGEVRGEVLQATARRFGLEGLPSPLVMVVFFVLSATVGMITHTAFALGEEIGWRGLLVPSLAKATGFTATALWSGVIWALWHYPFIILADYRGGAPRWFSLVCFTLMVIGISFAMAWLRLRSGSLWTGALFHASHNLFIQWVFDRLTGDTGVTEWIIGEFGLGLVLTGGLTGYLFWRKRAELPQCAFR